MSTEAWFSILSAQWARGRSETQMTLGELIAELQTMPEYAEVANLNSPHSYRGYYSDLAFEMGEGTRMAHELLSDCKASMGKVFCGYKGGDYVMGERTPVWIANYGDCGLKLIAIHAGGEVETAEDN